MDNVQLLNLSLGSSVLAISPHPDDIALSCGGLMRYLEISSVEITIVSCFTRSVYAPFALTESSSIDEICGLRQAEDQQYAQRIGAHYIALELDDTSIRYPDDEDEWICAQPQLEPVFDDLVEHLKYVVMGGSYTSVICPLAIGIHRDHYLVKAAIHLLLSGHLDVLYYEDLPYGARAGGPLAVEKFARQTLQECTDMTVDITPWIIRKQEDIQVYKSQIFPDEFESVIDYAADLGGEGRYAERIWTTGRSKSL